jgi:hypothetical protein
MNRPSTVYLRSPGTGINRTIAARFWYRSLPSTRQVLLISTVTGLRTHVTDCTYSTLHRQPSVFRPLPGELQYGSDSMERTVQSAQTVSAAGTSTWY